MQKHLCETSFVMTKNALPVQILLLRPCTVCCTGGEASKRRLVHSDALLIMTLNAVKANVRKCKACLKAKFKCACVTMCSLVMSLFSCDYIKAN